VCTHVAPRAHIYAISNNIYTGYLVTWYRTGQLLADMRRKEENCSYMRCATRTLKCFSSFAIDKQYKARYSSETLTGASIIYCLRALPVLIIKEVNVLEPASRQLHPLRYFVEGSGSSTLEGTRTDRLGSPSSQARPLSIPAAARPSSTLCTHQRRRRRI